MNIAHMSTSAQLPLCVYCGTERPADQSRCVTCGRTWIDIRVGTLHEIPVAVAVGAGISSPAIPKTGLGSEQTAEAPPMDTDNYFEDWDPWVEVPKTRGDRMRWLIPGVLAAAVVIVYGLIFFGFLDGTEEPVTTTAAAAAPTTTLAPPTTVAATTTTIATTTTTAPPTTTTTVPAPTSFRGNGDAIPLGQLGLRSAAIGPIELGMPAGAAIGSLVSSLGTAEESGAAGEAHGLCPSETGFWLRWGELTAVFVGDAESGSFASYRYAIPSGPPTSHLGLGTISGIHLGDSIADLESTYAKYNIAYESIDGASHFFLSEGSELLLWGPISSTEPSGRIEGIFSVNSCTTG